MIFPAGQLIHFRGKDRERKAADLIAAVGKDNAVVVKPGSVRLLRDCEMRLRGNLLPFKL